MQRVEAFSPATVANVACGFDILGFAIDAPGDIVIAERGSRPGLRFADDEPNDGFPRELKANTAGFAAWSLLQHLGEGKTSITLRLQKGMARGTGLGSSAASAAAAVVAVNTLLGMPLPKQALLRFAVAGEQKADGAWHADNVAPSLLGGMILIRDNAALDVISLPYPKALHAVVVHPAVQILTADARRVLAPKVPRAQWIAQSGDLAALIAALCLGDLALLGRCLNDHIIEPQRKHLIPKYDAVKAAALAAGALGAGISGSGPSMFALAASRVVAKRVATAMQAVFRKARLPCNAWVSPINATGAYVKSAS
ncbi:MAG: homoserine kinase [Myxococcales bacterium]|nr:homoserine kinase [Myxococcales bacterium]